MCLMITDAQISNIDDVWQTVQRMTARGNKFVLIQIGARSKFSEKVQANELAAHVISNHRQLHGLCLDYAQKVW